MKKVKNAALDMLLKYVAVSPMERLPAMLSLAEKLDR